MRLATSPVWQACKRCFGDLHGDGLLAYEESCWRIAPQSGGMLAIGVDAGVYAWWVAGRPLDDLRRSPPSFRRRYHVALEIPSDTQGLAFSADRWPSQRTAFPRLPKTD